MEVIRNIATALQCTEQTGLSVYVLLLAAAVKPMALCGSLEPFYFLSVF